MGHSSDRRPVENRSHGTPVGNRRHARFEHRCHEIVGNRRHARRGLTLVELVVVALLTGVVLFGLIGWSHAVRLQTRRELTVRVLAALNDALEGYRRREGAYPPASADQVSADALGRLLASAEPGGGLARLPEHLRRSPPAPPLVDPWGRPLQFIGAETAAARVEANAGRPIFVSAGADGDFGDLRPAGLGDNIASDDVDVMDPASLSASRPAMTPVEPRD